MHVELTHPELWWIFGGIAFLVILLFRAIIFKISFLGRALLCFSAGFALFFILFCFNFTDLIAVPQYDSTGNFDTHILNDAEYTVRYYYWYMAAIALAIGWTITFIWMMYHKKSHRYIEIQAQGKIFSLSMMLGFLLVLLFASFFSSELG